MVNLNLATFLCKHEKRLEMQRKQTMYLNNTYCGYLSPDKVPN